MNVVEEKPAEQELVREDWINVATAAELVWSPIAGTVTNVQTIHRWIKEGKIEALYRGRYAFVRRADVIRLGVPTARPRLAAVSEHEETPEERERREEFSRTTLKRAGFPSH